MYIVKCLPTNYHPYHSKWFFYYGQDNYGASSGQNSKYAVKYKTYREALDKAKLLWYDYRYESRILKIE
jgi:hypothetical protein